MALGKSIKLYLTIFIATTCMYMILYQYHTSSQPMLQPEIRKLKNKSNEKERSNGIGGSYTSSYSLYSNNISSTSSSNPLINNIPSVNAVKLQASNTTSLSTTKTSLSLLSLPSHSMKLLKKINLFLWSPMSLLSSSSSSSKRAISKKSSLALRQQKKEIISPFASTSTSSRIVDFNNTLIITSSTPSSTTTTATTISIKTPTTSATVATTTRIPTIKSPTELLQQTKQTRSTQPEQQEHQEHQSYKPPLFIITPTFRRPEQLAELTRLGYTLKHVANLLWLVIEDANSPSDIVIQILNRIGVPYEYFLAPMPDEYKKAKAKPRGVSNRNRGLQWLRENATDGVFYFADDDNTYDVNLFEQMRYTKKVSMWPVGLVTKYGVSSPIVKDGKLTGFYDGWLGGRKFPVDMAGFAVNVKFLHQRPNAKMPFKTGYEEDGFLKSLSPLNKNEIELLANNCTEILCWHTQTRKNAPAKKLNTTMYSNTNLILLDRMLVRL